ncbi:hypothetical protein [Cupriavidus pauculus]|uniref:hypothetical protein n=1 Tax=Cupriavidus pauculus TaxID=82633 RepID=UPI001D0C0CDC|nr:hypothetical protein [Cupriavidus pauculus]
MDDFGYPIVRDWQASLAFVAWEQDGAGLRRWDIYTANVAAMNERERRATRN